MQTKKRQYGHNRFVFFKLRSYSSPPSSSILKFCKTGHVLSSSGTGTRSYINDLCPTAIEKVTNIYRDLFP